MPSPSISSGRVYYGHDSIGSDHAVAIHGENVSDAYVAELREDGVLYIFAGPDGDDLPGAMAQLASIFGVKKLLLEGGGTTNDAFLRHRLIDEFGPPSTAWPVGRALSTIVARMENDRGQGRRFG
ncbi:dihydrofolate reductase family protein [Brucella rhizosphaerae]|uniref:dihydrofolate reductase family protein n=1 Tax=Brucella rhizosphaerae TaxID=571254 RepID=UPI0036196CBD